MVRRRLALSIACLLLWGARAAAEEPVATLATIRVPAGFTVEVAAAPPLVERPVMAGFDDRGRLYVADNAGRNLSAEELLEQRPNLIRLLEDTTGDGRFDRSTVFADKMTFPQGAAWFRGALYVASPPSIWRLEDTTGDGVADSRQELVTKFGFIGNAADIHGCFITPTGRVAWCDGRHGHEFKDADGRITSKGQAARIFSCLPDGGDVEVYCGGGMDNPVEVAFTPAGEMIGTLTFYNPDEVRNDALAHFVYGGVYPRKHAVTSEFKRTGELMPALRLFGVAAPSGLARYDSGAWGQTYRDNFFSTHFNTHKVVRHALEREGATFTSTDEDFLVSSSDDFHPTDVLVDADGSLLVIDTGGWFRNGCPTSQIAKPEILGAIYRVRPQNVPRIEDPRGLAIDWERSSDTELADLLADERPAVAERAIEWLVPRGDAAMGALATALFDGERRSRQNAMWALARIGSENARLLLRQGLSDDDVEGRIAAVKAVSDLRDAEALLSLIEMVQNDEPPVRREAATALGRLRDARAVPAILKALRRPADRFEEHALIYALIEIDDRPSTLAGLNDEGPAVRRAALIALDQMDTGNLTRDRIAPLLASDDAPLLRAVVEILGKHPDWTDELSGTLADWVALAEPSAEQLAMARGAFAALLGQAAVQKLAAEALGDTSTCQPMRLALLEAIAAAESSSPADAWNQAFALCLSNPDRDVAWQTIVAIAAVGNESLAPQLLETGLDAARPNDLRVAALRAASQSPRAVPPQAFEFLLRQLAESESLRDRLVAAEALGGFSLDTPQRGALAKRLAQASPLEISWLLRAFEGDSDPETGRLLATALADAPALATVAPERLREAVRGYPTQVQAAVETLAARAVPAAAERAAAVDALVEAAAAGDAQRGETIFFSARAACAACHRVGARGERIGPDLSKIGEIRGRRDLAEALLFPSASLARGYESYSVVTVEGQVHAGLIARETAAAIYLRTADRTEVRIDRAAVEQLAPSPTSIMPDGLAKTLAPAELGDLIAYLESLR